MVVLRCFVFFADQILNDDSSFTETVFAITLVAKKKFQWLNQKL